MRTERNMLRYIQYVDEALDTGKPVQKFNKWFVEYQEAQRATRIFPVMRWSDVLQSTITFNVSTNDQYLAGKQADELLKKLELKYAVEVGDSGRVLTTQEQKERAQKLLERTTKALNQIEIREQKKLDKMREQVVKQQQRLSRLGNQE